MAESKTEGVMTALKGRKSFAPKKGVSLLGIVEKLSKKRKAMKGDEEESEVEDKNETAKDEKKEEKAEKKAGK